tara:strand:- start:552 stop:1484 length:933 start_codon:yes stop_codon:yes gene_type:complete
MIKYIIFRIFKAFPIVLGVISVSFLLVYIAPGDPVLSMVGENYKEETVQQIRKELNLDKTIVEQYFLYMSKIFRLDFGQSYISGQEIYKIISQKIFFTFKLTFFSMMFAIVFGVFFGIISGINYKNKIDRLIVFLSIIGISSPVFSVALIFIYIFSIQLKVLPPSGYDGIQYFILPCIVLGLRSLSLFIRITRDSFIEIINEDYIRTAKSKGLKKHVIINKHVLKNLLIPIVTIVGIDFSSYLTGAVLTESIFGWPGIGRYLVDSILQRDFPAIQATVLFMSLVFVITNVLVDILYCFVNPKIREILIEK